MTKTQSCKLALALAPLWTTLASHNLWPQQSPIVLLGPNVQVSLERSHDAQGEVWIAADPTDLTRLVAASMIFPAGANRVATAVYSSFDGGKHWVETWQENQLARSDDPALAFGPDGTPFLAVTGEAVGRQRYLAVTHSADHGRTWLPPTMIPNSFETMHRQALVVDSTAGKFHGRVYLTGTGVIHSLDEAPGAETLSLLYSADQATTFHGPIKRAVLSPHSLTGHVTSAVLSDGTVVSLFGELISDNDSPAAAGHTNALLKAVSSADGGESLAPASTVSDWAMDLSDVSSHAAMLAVDPGSKWFKDRLYAVWPDRRSGRVQIFLAVSEDGGHAWSKPHVVDDDPAFGGDRQGPDDFMPAIAVNPAGVLGVVWCDRRDNADDIGWSMRFTASFDGGRTFLPSVKISDAANLYGRGEMWPLTARSTGGGALPGTPGGLFQVEIGVHPFYAIGGDYIGMAADSAGVFHPVWTDNRTGVPQVWTTALQVKGEGIRHGSTDLMDLRDVSQFASLEVKQVSFDRSKNLVTLSAQVKNTSNSAIEGPLKLLLFSLESALGTVEVVNADNGLTRPGAVWDFSSTLEGASLAPGQTTRPKLLHFRLTHLRPVRQGQDVRFGLVNIEAQLLGHIAR